MEKLAPFPVGPPLGALSPFPRILRDGLLPALSRLLPSLVISCIHRAERRRVKMNLFDHQRLQDAQRQAPLASRMRPRSLEEFAGQEAIIGEGRLCAVP